MANYQGTGGWSYNPFGDYDPFSEENNGLITWLEDVYNYWNSDRGIYQAQAILDKLTGGIISLDQRMSEMDATLKLYGKTWADVLAGYPYKTIGWSATGAAFGAAFGAGLNYMSSNISRLYR